MDVKKFIPDYREYLINTRRYLHEHPELSGEEVETAKFLKEEARKRNLEILETVENGFVAILDTGRPGKIIGLRTDIDALPIQESVTNLKQAKVSVSKKDGIMHACGHDAHMAMLLTAMNILCDIRDELRGRIIFIFEQGEERWKGIYEMVDLLSPLHLDFVYGMHVLSSLDVGKVAVDAGPIMGGAIGVQVKVIGRSGHISRPDLAANPIFAATNILSSITSAWANQLDVTKTVTLGIYQFHSGAASNIVPETAVFSGSLRFYDLDEAYRATEIIRKIAENVAEAHNCKIEFTTQNLNLAKPVVNDPQLAKIVQSSIEQVNPGALVNGVKWFASESFSVYRNLAPTVFAFVGIKNEGLGSGAEHHNDKFDLDEEGMVTGVETTIQSVLNFQNL